MSFNPNIPQATDRPSASQGQLLINFQQLNTIFNDDHVAWNDATVANRGLHRKVTFPIVSVGDPVLAGTVGQIYTKTVAGVAQAFFANSTSVFQITGATTTVAGGMTGFRAASGLIINYTSSLVAFSNAGTAFVFAVPFTAAPAIVAQTEGAGSANIGLSVAAVTNLGFTGFSSNPAANCYFIAIGF